MSTTDSVAEPADDKASERGPESAIERFDDACDQVFDRWRGDPAVDRVAYALSELGNFSLLWHLLATARAARSDEPLRDLARFGTLIAVEFAVVNGPVKALVQRERPDHTDERPHKLRQPLTSSFPSGHATSAFTAAALLSEGSRLGPLYYGLATAVAASRVHVRIHHASDVVGGVAIGVVIGAVARRLWPRSR